MFRQQVIRFLAIGSFATALNYGIFYICYKVLNLDYLLAYVAGFLSGVFAGYVFNKKWTFEVEDKNTYLAGYFIVYAVSLFLGMGVLKILVYMGIDPRLANFFTIGFTTCTNFAGIKFFVFKR